MKRRNFVKATLSAGTLSTTDPIEFKTNQTASPRANSSIGFKFLLPISRTGLPERGWSDWAKLAELIERVISNEKEAENFQRSPKKFLELAQLDSSPLVLNDKNFGLLAAVSTPAVRKSIARRDYASLFSYLEAARVFSNSPDDELTAEIEKILLESRMHVRSALGLRAGEKLKLEVAADLISGEDRPPTKIDIAVLGEAVGRLQTKAFVVATAAAAVLVAVYVSVALFASIGVAQYMKFSTKGSSEIPLLPMSTPPFPGGRARPLDAATSERLRLGARLSLMAKDPQIFELLEKDSTEREIRAIFIAMRNIGIMDFSAQELPHLISATVNFVRRSITGAMP